MDAIRRIQAAVALIDLAVSRAGALPWGRLALALSAAAVFEAVRRWTIRSWWP